VNETTTFYIQQIACFYTWSCNIIYPDHFLIEEQIPRFCGDLGVVWFLGLV